MRNARRHTNSDLPSRRKTLRLQRRVVRVRGENLHNGLDQAQGLFCPGRGIDEAREGLDDCHDDFLICRVLNLHPSGK